MKSRELRVLGASWKLKVKKFNGAWADKTGMCDPEKRVIYVHSGATGDDTLLHELMHAVEGMLGLELTEAQVRGLGVGMFAVLRDNPWVQEYLYPTKEGMVFESE